jgi:5'-methylthioadenosine phosphorylase
MDMTEAAVAVIGGTGLYDLEDPSEITEHRVDTPFGAPSDVIVERRIRGRRLLFISRHGRGHRFLPGEVNYRANLFALKVLGAEQVISISAVGSLQEAIRPGDLVVVRQLVDRTKGRPSTFFGSGIVGHVALADPVCPHLAEALRRAASTLEGVTVHDDKTLMVMEGPAFSTRAESVLHRRLGMDLIGMTAMPEAKLAREAELCYATLALATDYDCWHETEASVSVDGVVEVLRRNTANAMRVVAEMADLAPRERRCACAHALDHAVMTERSAMPADVVEKMKPVFGRVI